MELNVHTKFVAAKTRVSPLKKLSIPRLELLSTLLLSRLITATTEGLQEEIPISGRLYFTDSKVVLHWIRGIDKSWKPFVQNWAAEIRNLTSVECWNHCPGIQNQADIPLRGVTPQELSANELWCKGPSFVEPD